MVIFEGRIFQCSQGHAVCETCQPKLNNACPHCRGIYTGTRNYVLEEVIAKLKRFRSNDNINFDEDETQQPQTDESKSTNEAPENALVLHAVEFEFVEPEQTPTIAKLLAPSGK